MFHKDLTGQDLHAPSNQFTENHSGSTIPAMTAVTFVGIGLAFPSIVPVDGGTNRVRGITQTAVIDGASAYITSLGLMYSVDTSAWPVGTSLYANASGALGTTPHGTIVATVYKQDAIQGILFVENSFNGGGSGGGGNVTGPFSSTDKAIARWDGTSGTLLEDSKASVQDAGDVHAQGFITDRQVTGTVNVGATETWIAPTLDLQPGSVVNIGPGGQIIIL